MKYKFSKYTVILVIFIFTINILFLSPYSEIVFAKKMKDDKNEDKKDKKEKDKLVVEARIHLVNVDFANTKFIRVIGFINGEEAKQDIPVSSIDKTKNNLDVELKVNKKNEIVKAGTPDEFFVCAYQVGDLSKKSSALTEFDCNEGDIMSTSKPNEIN